MVPPDGGSRILFFSGGTALAPVAAELSRHTRNAVHVITTFDSGGSSAELRRAFDMPAVGDIRARIMALADRSLEGNPETVELLGYRLPKDAGRKPSTVSWRLSHPERIRWWPRFPSP